MTIIKKTPNAIRLQKQREALRRGDIATVKKLAKEAANELFEKGYVRANPAFPWILKDWLDKAIQEGVLVRTSTGFHPVLDESIREEVIGYKGRKPIVEKLVNSYSKYEDFCTRYEKHLEERRKKEFNEK